MGLRWLAKIMPHQPVYVSQKRALRDTADYIDELEMRQVALEGTIELLINDGDKAIYIRRLRHTRNWRETKKMARELAPDIEDVLLLVPEFFTRERDNVVVSKPLAREYDKTGGPPMGDEVCRYPGSTGDGTKGTVTGRMSSAEPNFKEVRPEDQLRAEVIPVTNSPGFPMSYPIGINAYGEKV